MTVWKFPLDIGGAPILMPFGAKIVLLAVQQGLPCIWAEVNPTAPTVERRFIPVGTGHPLPPGVRNHVGSVLMSNGELVLHFYEMLTDSPEWA